jgi:Leishmanolysin
MPRMKLLPWAAAVTIGLGSSAAQAAFDIRLNLDGVGATHRSYFEAAESFWEGVITGYQPGIQLTGMTIRAVTTLGIDGAAGVLGSAGWTTAAQAGGYWLATGGEMKFDSADVATLVQSGRFGEVIQHEMAHVLGFGTLWTHNGVYQNGSGRFVGTAALAQYRSEFNQPGALWVPVELGGGSGTANGHWDEINGGAGTTSTVDRSGRDMRTELMTGWLNGPTFVSRTTLASFQDIGYAVNLSAVPEPAALALWLLGLPLLAGVATRRRAAG